MFKLFLVELALIAHSLQVFNFTIQSSVTSYADNLLLCPSSLQDPDQTYIVTFKAKETTAIIHLTTTNEYVNKKFCELNVYPDQIEAANNSTDFKTRSDTTHYATYHYFIKRNSSNWCYIDRVIMQQDTMAVIARTATTRTTADLLLMTMSDFIGYPWYPVKCNGTHSDRYCFNDSALLMPYRLWDREISTHILVRGSAITIQDNLNNPLFYKLLWLGSNDYYIKSKSRWVPDVYDGFGYQSYNAVYYNGANKWPSLQDYFNKRLSSDTFGYGFPLVRSVSFDYHQKSYTTTSMFGCVHVYVYGLSDTLLTSNGAQTITMNQKTTNGNNPRRVFTYLDLKLEGQSVSGENYLKVTATLHTDTELNPGSSNLPPPITFTYMTPISKTMIDANRPSGPGSDCLTVFMCSATTYTGYPLQRAAGQPRNFEGDIVATFTIFPVEVENLPMDNFAADKNNVDRYTRQMSTPFNLTDDGRYLYNDDVGSSIAYTTTTGFDYDVRVRMFEFRHSLINYESFGLSYNTYNFGDYGYCLLPIPVEFRKDAAPQSKCNNWNYWNYTQPSAYPNCHTQWAGSNTCEHCKDGYGVDYYDFLNKGINYRCMDEISCKDPANQKTWVVGSLTNATTKKALCLSCPANCLTCNLTDCLSCSSSSSLFNDPTAYPLNSQRCGCGVANCFICNNTICDVCRKYDAVNDNGYMLVTAPTRTCTYYTAKSCPATYGFNYNFNYSGYLPPDYLQCIACQIPDCISCSDNAYYCYACASPKSLLNMYYALGPYYSGVVNCTDEHNNYYGMYEDTTARMYYACKADCKICWNDPNSCEECNPGFAFEPITKTCMSYAVCNLWTNGKYLNLTGARPLCLDCPANCLFCLNGSECINCTSTYLVYDSVKGTANSSQCVVRSTCGPLTNTFLSTKEIVSGAFFDVCLDCIPYCKICSDTTTCGECLPGYLYQPTFQKCLTLAQCRDSTHMSYDNTIPPAPPTCVDCNRNYRNCLSCYNDSFCDACVSPTALYHLDLNLCVESTECGKPLTSYPLGRYCKKCKVGCELCSNDTDCWKCSTGTLDSDNATCLATCRLYTTQKNATHCIDCPQNCEICNYTATSSTTTLTSLTQPLQCEHCLSGYFFDTQGKCVQCNKQIEFLISNTCHICQVSNCKTCNNTVDTCVDCIDQYYVNTTGGCSLCQLPLTYTVNKTCLPCEVPNCEICDKSNLQLCVTCQKGFYKEGLVCAPRFFQILKHSFSSDSLEISIKFEHKIKEFNNSNFIPTVQEPNNTNSRVNLSVITSTKDASDPRLYRIKVDKLPKKSELDLNLTVLDSFNVLSSEKATYTLNPNNTTLIFDRLSRYIPDSAELSATASAAVTTTTTVLMAIGSVLAFNYAVIMMKIYQMMEFMLLYNVEYPYNFSRFIELFKTADPLKMLPSLFESFYDDTCQVLGDKFVTQEMGCQFLDNCGPTMQILCFYLVGKVTINLIYCFSKNKTGKIAAFIVKAKRGAFGAEGFFKILTMFEMDLFLGAYTNSKYYAGDQYRTIQNIGNHLFAQTLIYSYPMVIFYYFIRTREIYQYSEGRIDMDEDVAARYEFLIEERKDVTWYHKYCEVLSMLRSYTTCATVVTFYEYPSVQLIITTILILVTLILEVIHRPRKSKLETTVSIVIWVAYLGLALCFNFIHFLGGSKSKEFIYIYVGYPMIMFFCVLVAINFIPVIINIASSLYKAIVKCKNRNKFKNVNSKDSKETSGIPAQNDSEVQKIGSSGLDCTPELNKVSPSKPIGDRDQRKIRVPRRSPMASDSFGESIGASKRKVLRDVK